MDDPRPDDNPSEQPDKPAQQPDQSEQQPVDISADVDALLAEASALAGQIAEDTGAEVDPDGTPALGDADAMAAEPKEAVDEVEAKLAELESLVNEAAEDDGPATGALQEDAPTADDAVDGDLSEDTVGETDQSNEAAESSEDDSDFSTNPADESDTFDTNAEDEAAGGDETASEAEQTAPADEAPTKDTAAPAAAQTSNEFADEAFDESLVGDVEVSLDESIMDEPEDFGLDAGESKAAALRKPLAKLLDVPKMALAVFKRIFARGFFQRLGDTIIFRAIWAGLELIDGPFANLSPNAKRNIGIIGLITLICGILSLVLPGMFESNPYLDMVSNP